MDMHVEPLATNGPAGRGGSRPNRRGGQVYLVTHKRPPRIGGLFVFVGSAYRVFQCAP